MTFDMGPLPSTSGRDRTSEFHAIADRLRKAHGPIPYANGGPNGTVANGHGSSESSRLLQPQSQPPTGGGSLQSEFSKRASQIGLSIHQTSQKLAKLAKCEFILVSGRLCACLYVCLCSSFMVTDVEILLSLECMAEAMI